jgi:hypothetical protein
LKPQITLSQISENFERFSNLVSQYQQTPALIHCWEFSKNFFAKNTPVIMFENSLISPWFIAYFAKELLMYASDLSPNEMSKSDFARLATYYNEWLIDPIVTWEKKQKDDALLSWRLKVDYEQFFWQNPIKNWIPRAYYMYFAHPNPIVKSKQNKFTYKLQDIYGLDYIDMFRIAVAISVSFNSRPTLNKTTLINSEVDFAKESLTDEKIDTVLNELCIDVEGFRQAQREFTHVDVFQRRYELNCLRKYPLIRNLNGEVICPVPLLISNKIMNGIYYDIIDHCRETGQNYHDYTDPFGDLFSEYVGLILSEIYDNQHLLNVDSMISNNVPQRHCDWVIIEGNYAILIECKASRLPLEVVSTGDVDKFRKFLLETYLKEGKPQYDFPGTF